MFSRGNNNRQDRLYENTQSNQQGGVIHAQAVPTGQQQQQGGPHVVNNAQALPVQYQQEPLPVCKQCGRSFQRKAGIRPTDGRYHKCPRCTGSWAEASIFFDTCTIS
jgi:hypothetical protein